MPLPPPAFPKITAPTASEVCQGYTPRPEAKALLTPAQTPAEYLQTLRANQLSEESIRFLAHGLPDREATWWAAQSARQVANPANPADGEAIRAADAWVKNPTPATQQAAAAAAAKTDYQTPGAWAAQAAAWSQPPATPPVPGLSAPVAPSLPGVPVAPAVPRLTPHAASGAVMLAAALAAKPQIAVPKVAAPPMPTLEKPALPKGQLPTAPELPQPPPTPKQRAETARAQAPFVTLGMAVAKGTNTWL
jgi:hypothetical protein